MKHLTPTNLTLATLAALGITLSSGAADAKPVKPTKVSHFAKIDVSGDGLISLREMTAAHNKRARAKKTRRASAKVKHAHPRRAWVAIKGKPSKSKYHQVKQSRAVKGRWVRSSTSAKKRRRTRLTVAQRFAKMDQNSDGYISRAEMARARAARKAKRNKRSRRSKRTKMHTKRPVKRTKVAPPRIRPTPVRAAPPVHTTSFFKLGASFKLSLI